MTHDGPVLDTVGDCTVIACETCRFTHVWPLPSRTELAAFYETYYIHEKPDYFAREEEDGEWWDATYRQRLGFLKAWLAHEQPYRLLDIGSGPGRFLKVARDCGWDIDGLEPSAAARRYALERYNVFTGDVRDFEEDLLCRSAFHVVHLGEVLEHVADPGTYLRRAMELLVPGGLVSIVVPNDYNPLQQALVAQGLPKWWLAPPAHLNYFTQGTLADLLTRSGFRPVHATTNFPMEVFALMGDVYIGNEAVGRAVHAKRKAFERALRQTPEGVLLLNRLYQFFSDLDIGRDIWMVGRKP